MEIDAETIEVIWQALQEPVPVIPRRADAIGKRIVEAGWASRASIEDFLLSQDRRLNPPFIINPTAFANALGFPFRAAFPRPARRNDGTLGSKMLSAADTAALCIWLERLGFAIDVTGLCAGIRPGLMTTTHLTEEQISVLFYEQNRHRLPPVTLSAPPRQWRGVKTSRYKTSLGYRLEYVTDDDGRALRLTVRSPKYRKPPEEVETTCSDCGMSYMKGSRTDEQEHRSFHRQRLSIIAPKPHRRMKQALNRNPDAAWVDVRSPTWKRKEAYDRALEFKREFGYDFVQWALDAAHDPEAVGFLFSDEHDRIVGACSFRPQPGAGGRPWRLDWIWMCPDARQHGHLSHQWGHFLERFGIFDIAPPVSAAMQAFLRKQGCADLIT